MQVCESASTFYYKICTTQFFVNISAQMKDSFTLSFTCKESYLTFDQEHIIKCGKAFQKFLLPLDILQWSSCVIKMSNITIP